MSLMTTMGTSAAGKNSDGRRTGPSAPPPTQGFVTPDAFRNAIRDDIDRLFELRDVLATRYGDDAVHDIRVIIRRLLTVAAFAKRLGLPAQPRRLRKALRVVRKGLGGARDCAVLMAEVLPRFVKKTGNAVPPALLSSIKAALRCLRSEARAVTVAQLAPTVQSGAEAWLLAIAAMCAPRSGSHGGDASASFGALARDEIDHAFARADRRAACLRKGRRRSLHPCRIVVKELRYTAAFLMPYVGTQQSETWTESLGDVQRQLGRANDAWVAAKRLSELEEVDPRLLDQFKKWARAERRHGMRKASTQWSDIEVAYRGWRKSSSSPCAEWSCHPFSVPEKRARPQSGQKEHVARRQRNA